MQLAQQFAAFIDSSSFDEVGALIAENCAYHYFEGSYQGRSAIVSIYRNNTLYTRRMFDEVKYYSDVEEMGDGIFKINFLDQYRKGHKWHDHRFFEMITIKNNLIVDIQNNQIAGEEEALRTFYTVQSNRANL